MEAHIRWGCKRELFGTSLRIFLHGTKVSFIVELEKVVIDESMMMIVMDNRMLLRLGIVVEQDECKIK